MKICVDCEFCHKQGMQVAPNQLATVVFCSHSECRNPVTGEPLPAQNARQMNEFCGISGKYFKAMPQSKAEVQDAQIIEVIERPRKE